MLEAVTESAVKTTLSEYRNATKVLVGQQVVIRSTSNVGIVFRDD